MSTSKTRAATGFVVALATASWVLVGTVFYLQANAQELFNNGVTVTTVLLVCGDGTCASEETAVSCPEDCLATAAVTDTDTTTSAADTTGAATIAVTCGNGVCETADGESIATCSLDCGGQVTTTFICGDARCDAHLGEASNNCPSDCPATVTHVCGDGTCAGAETSATCSADCGAPPPANSCGNGACEENLGETTASCQADCPATAAVNIQTSSCGDGVCGNGENSVACPVDCPVAAVAAPATATATTTVAAPTYVCGDARCERDRGENEADCPSDCRAAAPPTTACTDSDGGKALKVRGTVRFGTATRADICASTVSVREHFCENGKPADAVLACGAGSSCQDGACVAATTTVTGTSATAAPTTNTTTVTAPVAPPTALVPPPPSAPALPEKCLAVGLTTAAGCAQLLRAESAATAGAPTASVTSPPVAPKDWPALCRRLDLFTQAGCRAALEQAKPAAAPAAGVSVTPTVGAGISDACLAGTANRPRECLEQLAEAAVTPSCLKAGVNDAAGCQIMLAGRRWPTVCVEAGVLENEACRLLVEKTYWPPYCETRGLTSRPACRDAVFSAFGLPASCAALDKDSCWRLIEDGRLDDAAYEARLGAALVAARCVASGIATASECRSLAAREGVSETCRLAGYLTVEACRKHEFAASQAVATAETMPERCLAAGLTDPAACAAAFAAENLPVECVKAGVSGIADCRRYLAHKDLPAACLDAGVEDRAACERLLVARAANRYCATEMWKGLGPIGEWTEEQQAACRETVFRAVAADLRCEGVTAEECAHMAKESYLGQLADVAARLAPLRDSALNSAGVVSVAMPSLEKDDPELGHAAGEMMPLTNVARVALWRSAGAVVIDESGTVSAAAPMVALLDGDGDGVPDDVERRRGLDPQNPMTDGRRPDVEVLRAKPGLAPVEMAMAHGKPLGQPRAEGRRDERLAVAGVASAGRDEAARTVFSGRGVAGETVTVYVYSDLPLVMTTTVDENGEWSYELEGSLRDGLHEVYVVVNDDTGKVARKGNPLSFVVQAAQAVTVSEAMAAEGLAAADVNVAGGPIEAYTQLYLLGGLALLVVAGLILAAFALGRREKGI